MVTVVTVTCVVVLVVLRVTVCVWVTHTHSNVGCALYVGGDGSCWRDISLLCAMLCVRVCHLAIATTDVLGTM